MSAWSQCENAPPAFSTSTLPAFIIWCDLMELNHLETSLLAGYSRTPYRSGKIALCLSFQAASQSLQYQRSVRRISCVSRFDQPAQHGYPVAYQGLSLIPEVMSFHQSTVMHCAVFPCRHVARHKLEQSTGRFRVIFAPPGTNRLCLEWPTDVWLLQDQGSNLITALTCDPYAYAIRKRNHLFFRLNSELKSPSHCTRFAY